MCLKNVQHEMQKKDKYTAQQQHHEFGFEAVLKATTFPTKIVKQYRIIVSPAQANANLMETETIPDTISQTNTQRKSH
jgi:hypothetical protein